MYGHSLVDWFALIWVLGYLRVTGFRYAPSKPFSARMQAWTSLMGLWAVVDWHRKNRGPDSIITIWKPYDSSHPTANMTALEYLYRRLKHLAIRLWYEHVHSSLMRLITIVENTLCYLIAMVVVLVIWPGPLVWLPIAWCVLAVKRQNAASISLGILWALLLWFSIFRGTRHTVSTEGWRVGFAPFAGQEQSTSSGRPASASLRDPLPLPEQLRDPRIPPEVVFRLGIVHALRERRAGEPRDKVYALHSILKRGGATLAKVQYQQAVSVVYTNFFHNLLAWNRAFITLILDAGLAHATDGRPSWVPDWRNDGHRTWLDRDYFYSQNIETATPGMNAHKNNIHSSGGRLPLQAFLFDKCHQSAVHAQKFMPPGPSDTSCNIKASARHSEDLVDGVETNGLESSTFRFLAVFLPLLHQVLSSRWSVGLLDILQVLNGKSAELRSSNVPHGLTTYFYRVQECVRADRHCECLAWLAETFEASPESLRWLASCAASLQGRRCMFVTRGGRLGTGPLDMEAGDDVALVNGIPVPLIVRRTEGNGTYVLIGPAFVQDAMKGEAWSDHYHVPITLV